MAQSPEPGAESPHIMTVQTWLEHAVADAERRGLAGLKSFLEALAQSTDSLRKADDELRAAEESDQMDERAQS